MSNKCSFCLKPCACHFCDDKCRANFDKFSKHACHCCGKFYSFIRDAEKFYSSIPPSVNFCSAECEADYNSNENVKFMKECREHHSRMDERLAKIESTLDTLIKSRRGC